MAYVAHNLAATPKVPAWMGNSEEVLAQLHGALNGKTHRERWKYTNAKPILEMLPLPASRPSWKALPDGISVQSVDVADLSPTLSAGVEAAPEAHAVFCYQDSVDVVTVTGTASAPLCIDHGPRTRPIILRLLANSTLDLRETFASEASDQVHSLWVELDKNSRLTHSRNNFAHGKQWQFLHVVIGRDAIYSLHNHSTGAALRRQDIQITCAEPGAAAELASAAYIGPGQHYDQQITVEHAAPNTTSVQTVHNVAGDRAKVTFNGRIQIHPDCRGADAQLTNKNLISDGNATVNTKPELEIYTDDVKCAHGATVGQLDPDHLFYFASRGIDEAQARELLSSAFLNACIGGPLKSEAQSLLQDLRNG